MREHITDLGRTHITYRALHVRKVSEEETPMKPETCSCPSYVHLGYARATTLILCAIVVVLGAANIVQGLTIITLTASQ